VGSTAAGCLPGGGLWGVCSGEPIPACQRSRREASLGRANTAKFVERLCKYPGDARVIAEAQQHILEAHAERLTKEGGTGGPPVTVEDIIEGRAPRPKVLDMFAGGGAIPLEALRLGCEAYALDLNPVAHIIELCTLVYPQKYGKPDPTAKGSAKDGTWAGLAAEVRYWGNWVLEKVKAEIGDLYPLIPDPDYRAKNGGTGFQPVQGDLFIQTQGKEKRVGAQLMAVVCTRPGAKGKTYLSGSDLPAELLPDEEAVHQRIEALCKKARLTVPYEPISLLRPSPNARGLSAVTRHGLTTFGDLFTSRQMLCLLTFAAAVREAPQVIVGQASVEQASSLLESTGKMPVLPGDYDEEQAKGVAMALAIAVDRVADRGSSLCHWDNAYTKTANTFGRQALPMV